MKRLIIIGASGHGKVVADIARLNGYKDIAFLDRNSSLKECMCYPVVGSDIEAPASDGEIFVAVGDAQTRKRLMENNPDKMFPVLIHPQAVVADDVTIGAGTVIMAGTVINPGARIGKGCIINTASSADHDCIVGDYCHVSVGAHLSGTVRVGDCTWIGAGVIVSNNINICSGVIIGAGAVVIKDIEEEGIYIGVPARRMMEKNVGGGYSLAFRNTVSLPVSDHGRVA